MMDIASVKEIQEMNLLVDDSRVILDRGTLETIVDIGGREVEKVLAPNVDLGDHLIQADGVNMGVESISKAGKVGVQRGELIRETREKLEKEASQLLQQVKETIAITIGDDDDDKQLPVEHFEEEPIQITNSSSTSSSSASFK